MADILVMFTTCLQLDIAIMRVANTQSTTEKLNISRAIYEKKHRVGYRPLEHEI